MCKRKLGEYIELTLCSLSGKKGQAIEDLNRTVALLDEIKDLYGNAPLKRYKKEGNVCQQ
jgi:hypothetical protein